MSRKEAQQQSQAKSPHPSRRTLRAQGSRPTGSGTSELPANSDYLRLYCPIPGAAEDRADYKKTPGQAANRILQAYLVSNTEEELGLLCLQIAEAITRSKFGFIGKIGADGLLHDIAMSAPGRQSCEMYDKTGHQIARKDLEIHGLLGRVIADGKSLLSNAPSFHPDSIGTPPGHPAISAFLASPLTRAGKTVGIIALANKNGGYTSQDLEALETLAPNIAETMTRRQAEEENRRLAESVQQERDKLRALIDSIPDEVWFVDLEKNISLVNPPALQEFGLSSPENSNLEALTNNLEIYGPDGHRRPLEETLPLRALRGEIIKNQEEIIRTPATGELRYRRVSAAPVRNAQGRIIGSISVVRDIHELKQAEQDLRQTQDYLESLINHASVPIIVWNPDFEIQLFNHAFEHLSGRSAGEVCGRKLEILFPEDEREAFMDLIRGASVGKQWEAVEIPILHQNGEIHTILWNSTTIYAADRKRVIATIAQGLDITERKKAEDALRESQKKYQALVESTSDFIWEVDRQGRYTYCSPQIKTLWGFEPQEMIGKTPIDVMPSDTPDASTIYVLGLTENPAPFRTEKTSYNSKGELVTLEVSGAPFFDQNGALAGYRGISRDITERKRMEHIKDEFIGMVSHELRTPLTVVIGALNAIKDKRVSERERGQLIDDAESSAASLEGILANMLELSRYQAGRLHLGKTRVRISDVAKVALQRVRRKSISHKFIMDIPKDIPEVNIDTLRMEQVMYNLLDNAVKYSPEGSQVHLFGRQEKDNLVVGVHNQGIGIAPDQQAKLFEPFGRLVDGAVAKGIGLGLVVCKRLVEAHGGRIWVESRSDEGTTFFFSIPLSD